MSDIISDVVPDTVPDVYFFQVERLVRLLKHKIIPENAYHKEHNFDFILSAPNEELHQFLIDLYGDHLLPATKHEIEKCLRGPDTIKSFNKKKEPEYFISKKMLRGVRKRLRDRLASVDSRTDAPTPGPPPRPTRPGSAAQQSGDSDVASLQPEPRRSGGVRSRGPDASGRPGTRAAATPRTRNSGAPMQSEP